MSPFQDPFGRSTRKEEFELDFTSMIDVVFLLMIFFMVQSALASQTDVDLPPAHRGKGLDPSTMTVVTILAPESPGGAPRYRIGSGGGKSATLEEARQFMQSGVRDGRTHVVVRAERKVPHRYVLEVARAAGRTEGAELSFAVQEAR